MYLLHINESLIRTFIWNAVQLKKFGISQRAHHKYMTQQHHLGSDMLVVELPNFFESSSLIRFNNLLSDISSLDPFWLNKLPYMAAFGYTQGLLIHELRGGSEDTKKSIGLSSSIFNICISLFDYIVDELPTRNKIFKIVNHDFILDLMNRSSPRTSVEKIFLHKNDSIDKREYLLLWLVVAFSISCRLLYQHNKSDKAWDHLLTTIFQLYEAEKISCEIHIDNAFMLNKQQLLNILKCKSVMPFLSTYFISKIASPINRPKEQENKIKEICKTIGSIFCISDDLADIAKDLKSGTLSYIILNIPIIHQSKNNIFDYETFCETLIPSIEYLLNLLDKLDKQLQSIPISTNTYYKVMEFVKMYVTSWIANW
jgi:hypothetical protein